MPCAISNGCCGTSRCRTELRDTNCGHIRTFRVSFCLMSLGRALKSLDCQLAYVEVRVAQTGFTCLSEPFYIYIYTHTHTDTRTRSSTMTASLTEFTLCVCIYIYSPPRLVFHLYGVNISSAVQRPVHENNHTLHCSAEVKDKWNCTSTTPVCLHCM